MCLSASLGVQQTKLRLQRLQEKRCSVLVNKIIEDLNDNGCPQSEGITSVCLANEAWAALLR